MVRVIECVGSDCAVAVEWLALETLRCMPSMERMRMFGGSARLSENNFDSTPFC